MTSRRIATTGIVVAIGMIAGCSATGGMKPGVQPHSVAAKAPSKAVTTPAAPITTASAAASAVGTWDVFYSTDLTDVLGEYSITQPTAGDYTITTETALRLPDGNCSVPANTEEGTFSAVANETYAFSGTEKVWEPSTCAYAYMSSFTATLVGDTMRLYIANAEPDQFTLTRAGSTASPVATPSATQPVSAAPSLPGATIDGTNTKDCGTPGNAYSAHGDAYAGADTSCPFALAVETRATS
jgi:hypothetical protein